MRNALGTVAVLAILAATPAMAEETDWTGFYAGVFGGLAGGQQVYPFEINMGGDFIAGQADINSSGFFAGAQAGFDYEVNGMLIGVVTDLSWANITGQLGVDINSNLGFSADAMIGSTVDWFGTARLRAGAPVTDDLLVYATGGVAFGSVTYSYEANWNGSGGSDSISDMQIGWTAGAGFEYKVADNISLQTEYLFVDLGSRNLEQWSGGGGDARIDGDTAFHTVKAGVNFRFD